MKNSYQLSVISYQAVAASLSRRVCLFLLLVTCHLSLVTAAQAAFTEFYCQSGGSNLNAGSTTSNSAAFTYASGSWVASTGVFAVASGNPSSDGVAVGDFASVFPDGATVAVFIGRVTARSTTTITVSLSAKSGTAPTDGTSNRTLKIGGAWKGPNGADGFPFNFAMEVMSNAAANPARVNLKNDQTYSITAAITAAASSNFVTFQGYSSSLGDGGRAIIDGGTSGASYILFSIAVFNALADLIFQNNGATGSASLVSGSGPADRCVFAHSRGNGFAAGSVIVTECEAYDCNQSNTANLGGLTASGGSPVFVRCVSHDNAGSNSHGFRITGSKMLFCVADTNGGNGVSVGGGAETLIHGCDIYNNSGAGISATSNSAMAVVSNSNVLKNTGVGITDANNGGGSWRLQKCGFGSGSQVNGGGDTSFHARKALWITDSVNYAANVTPWVDPANGDFRINLKAAKNAGRGSFLQTQSGYAGTIAYPDIGAAQHKDPQGVPLRPR